MPHLTATVRESKGRKNYALRAEGQLPGIIYGAIAAPISVALDRRAFVKLYQEVGESTILDLDISGKTYPVLIQDYQIDPLHHQMIHVDFRAIDMTKEMEATVELVLEGEAPAVKALGGTLVHSLHEVTVRCLPSILPKEIRVNVSGLSTFEDSIRVKDLVVAEGVKVMDNGQATIANVLPPLTEAELAELDKAVEVDVTAVEVAGKKKEEEGAEGEAATAAGAAPADAAKKAEPAKKKA